MLNLLETVQALYIHKITPEFDTFSYIKTP